MTEAEFEEKTGRKPHNDDLERVNCILAGSQAHSMCGWCQEHDKPRFECGCMLTVKRGPYWKWTQK